MPHVLQVSEYSQNTERHTEHTQAMSSAFGGWWQKQAHLGREDERKRQAQRARGRRCMSGCARIVTGGEFAPRSVHDSISRMTRIILLVF